MGRIEKFNKEGMMPQGLQIYGAGNYFDENLGFTTKQYAYNKKTGMYYFEMLLIFLQKPFARPVTNTSCSCEECRHTYWEHDSKNLTPVFRPTNQVWGIAHEFGCINIKSF